MITENELREVLKNWDISQNLKLNNVCTMDGKKVSGNVWILGDKYVLKTGERDFILKNLRVQKALAKQGFSSIVPIYTKSGAEYLDGERVYTLMQKVTGAPLQKSDRLGDNRYDFGFKYGQSIAKLHRALSDVEKDIMPNEVKIYEQITNWAMPDVKKQNEQWKIGLSDSFFEDYIKTFGAFESQLPKQLIHRDPNPSNILFNGGEVSGFIDFDLSERNIRLWDPCYCATGILSEGTGVDNIQEKWFAVLNGILHGYNSVNPLTDEEKQAVFYVVCSIQMICAAYFESINEYKELAKISREMLFFIAENKARIMAIF